MLAPFWQNEICTGKDYDQVACAAIDCCIYSNSEGGCVGNEFNVADEPLDPNAMFAESSPP